MLVPACGRQRQEDLCELEVTLVYQVSFKRARTVTQKTLLQEKKSKVPMTMIEGLRKIMQSSRSISKQGSTYIQEVTSVVGQ